jgi:hypothetical protein
MKCVYHELLSDKPKYAIPIHLHVRVLTCVGVFRFLCHPIRSIIIYRCYPYQGGFQTEVFFDTSICSCYLNIVLAGQAISIKSLLQLCCKDVFRLLREYSVEEGTLSIEEGALGN